MSSGLDPATLAEDLRARDFKAHRGPGTSSEGLEGARVGLEVEAIPVERSTGRVARLSASSPGSLEHAMEEAARARGWRFAGRPEYPRFVTGAGDVLSFEPGGQLEWASRPEGWVPELVRRAYDDLRALEEVMARLGMALLYRGMDPTTSEDDAPLQLRTERYLRMDRHFSAIGPWGRRMMRQSASLHVNLDWVGPVELQWRVANALVPVLTAAFANSARWAGRDTGHRSYRAAQWRRLDPSRTGIFPARGPDPVPEYLAFALEAPSFLLSEDGIAAPFRSHLQDPRVGIRQWREHLSTLFPEVRPRGYLEIRAMDALRPEHLVAPVVFLAGILYHSPTLKEAARVLPVPTEERVERAGRVGLLDEELRAEARTLVRLALEGAGHLPELFDDAVRSSARRFFERFTLRGLDPAGDG